MNKKVNLNHESIDDIKHLVTNKLARIEDDLVNKKNDLVPFEMEIRNVEGNIWKLGEEIDLMRIDNNTFRDHESSKSRELDNHLKSSTN